MTQKQIEIHTTTNPDFWHILADGKQMGWMEKTTDRHNDNEECFAVHRNQGGPTSNYPTQADAEFAVMHRAWLTPKEATMHPPTAFKEDGRSQEGCSTTRITREVSMLNGEASGYWRVSFGGCYITCIYAEGDPEKFIIDLPQGKTKEFDSLEAASKFARETTWATSIG